MFANHREINSQLVRKCLFIFSWGRIYQHFIIMLL